jgi:hypothetical protein
MLSFIQIIAIGFALHSSPAAPAQATLSAATLSAGAQVATYVPVCKNSRGIFDRRACGKKSDPRRGQLA